MSVLPRPLAIPGALAAALLGASLGIAAEYRAGHIPTAVNIPEPQMEQKRDRLPRDRNAVLVFYCNGHPECKKSHDASKKAVAWGYRNVFWFRDGIPAWQARGFPVE